MMVLFWKLIWRNRVVSLSVITKFISPTANQIVKAFLQHPLGVAVAGKKIYVADTLNHKIKALDLDSKMVSTVWGSGKPGDADGEYPQFNEPNGIAYDGQKNLYIADTNNNAIKVGNLQTGMVSTLKITGLTAPVKAN